MLPRWLDAGSLAFASITVGLSLVNVPFNFFYVKVFLEVYGVRESHFQLAQGLFLVWNAINDPLFAYCLDNRLAGLCCASRRASVMAGAPILGAAFVITWLPWGFPGSAAVGAHLVTSLCVYDSLFTFVALAHCAIFAEMSTNFERRLNTKRYQVLGALAVAWSVPLLNLVSSNLTNFLAFQLGCLALAAISTGFVYFGGRYSTSVYDRIDAELSSAGTLAETESGEMAATATNAATVAPADASGNHGGKSGSSVGTQLRQIVFQRDFLAFVSTNFLQIFEATMWANFLPIFMEPLGPASPWSRSFIYLLVAVLPPLIVSFGLPLIRWHGHHRAVAATIAFKILAGPVLFALSPLPPFSHSASWLFAAYVVASQSLNNAAFSLFDLPLSELVDRDRAVHGRRLPMSSTVFGINALLTKPAVSLAPLAVVALLNRYGYRVMRNAKATASAVSAPTPPSYPADLTSVMLSVACWLPAIVGCLQMLCWSCYRIRNRVN